MKIKISILLLIVVHSLKAQSFEKGYETIIHSIIPMLYVAEGMIPLPAEEKGEENEYRYASFIKEDGQIPNNSGSTSKLHKVAWNKTLDFAKVYHKACNTSLQNFRFVEWEGNRIKKFQNFNTWELQYNKDGQVTGMKRTDYSNYGKSAKSDFYTIKEEDDKQVIRFYVSIGKAKNGIFEEKYSYLKYEKVLDIKGDLHIQTITKYRDQNKSGAKAEVNSVQVMEFDLSTDEITKHKETDESGSLVFQKEIIYNEKGDVIRATELYGPDNKKTTFDFVLNNDGFLEEGAIKKYDSEGVRIYFSKRFYEYNTENPCEKAGELSQELDKNDEVVKEIKGRKFREKIDGKWSDWRFFNY